MKFERWISFRYLTAKKERFLSFLNWVSIVGVAIGVTSLIVVTGVMTGFGNNLREKIIGTSPHIMIEKEIGIKNYQLLEKEVNSIEDVLGVSAYVQGNIFLENKNRALALVLRGIQPEKETSVTKVKEYLIEGKLESLTENKVFIGKELARYFGYNVGDTITVISPGSGISGKGWRYTLEITGIFNTGMADYDMNLVIVHLRQAQQIYNLAENMATGLGVKISDPTKAGDIKKQIYSVIGFGFIVRTWIDINQNLFEALFLEKWGLFIILTLMVLVASFNIISTLIVTVSSKIHDIGILKSMGVSRGSIAQIFIQQGFLIGLIGTLLGLAGGVVLSYVLRTYVKVPQQIYSIDRVPIDLQVFDVSVIVLSALGISFLATIYPSLKASNLTPVEALRYE